MKLIEWRDEFSLGIPAVDHEHRELIELINTLFEEYSKKESRTSVLDFLGELHAGIAAHFALEERIMRERGYDQYLAHKTDHEKLLDEIRDFMDDYEDKDDFPKDYFNELLHSWFVGHFRDMDARLHKYM